MDTSEPNFEHSWLVTPNKNIIDVYPIGILGRPILVDKIVTHYLYLPDNSVLGTCVASFATYLWCSKRYRKWTVSLSIPTAYGERKR